MTGFQSPRPPRAPAWRAPQVVGGVALAAAALFACDGGPTAPGAGGDTIGAEGGTVVSADGDATLVVPPSALAGTVRITVERVESPPGGSVGKVFRIGPSGTQFSPAAQLSLRHDPGAPDDLAIATYRDGAWVPLPTTADPAARTLTAPVTHLSLFGMIGPGDAEITACGDLRLEADSGPPGTSLVLRGVSPELLANEIEARVLVDGVAETLPTYIEHIDADLALVIVPAHPVGRLAGGDAELAVFAGTIECPGISFTIEALPGAPGTLQEAVDLLDSTFTQLGRSLGYERETLLTTPVGELPGDAMAAAGALQALAGPDFENSLSAILAGTAPILEGVQPDLEMLDAVLASTDLLDGLKTIAEALVADSPPTGPVGMAPGSPSVSRDRVPGDAATVVQASTGGFCNGERFDTPAFLDRAMNSHHEALKMRTGAARAINEGVGAGLATVGLLGGPGAAAAAGAASMMLTMINIALDVQAGQFPSELENILLTAEGRTFNEDADPADATGRGEWEAEVAAWSTGYELDLPTVLGAVPGLGTATKIFAKVAHRTPIVNVVTAKTMDFVHTMMAAAWGTYETDGAMVIKPCRYGPVQVDPGRAEEREFFDWRLLGSDGAFAFGEDEKEYHVQAAGVSELRVETSPQRFLGQHRIAQAELQVEEIQVLVLAAGGGAPPYILEPGESIDMVAEVLNAHDRNVTWGAPLGGSIPPGQWDPSLQPVGETYTAPMEPGTYIVEAESASRRGPRASGEPPRIGSARVIVGGLRLSPRPTCIRVGETVQFSATIGGEPVDFSELEVVATNGTISSDGTFTPAGLGEAKVHARSKEQPSLTDELSFQVADLCTSWSMSITGDYFFEGGGQCVEAFGTDPEDGAPPALWTFGVDEVVGIGIGEASGLGMVPLGEPGQPTTLTGSFAGLLFFRDAVWFPAAGAAAPTIALTVTWEPIDAPDGSTWAELSGSFHESFMRVVGPEHTENVTVSGEFSGVVLNLGYDMSCN